MKIMTRLPLLFGLGIMVLAVVISTMKISEQRSLSNSSHASNDGAILTLVNSNKGLVTLTLTSNKEVAGVDAIIKFEKDKIKILPSTLTSGSSFITSGGDIDENANTFSFSALTKDVTVTSGLVASFKVEPVSNGETETSLDFDLGDGKTGVVEKTSGSNILISANGVKFKPL